MSLKLPCLMISRCNRYPLIRNLTSWMNSSACRKHPRIFPRFCIMGTLAYCTAEKPKLPTSSTEILNQTLIKLASVEAVNSATNLLTQVTTAILMMQEDYKRVMERLLVIFERTLTSTGVPDPDDHWDEIVSLRWLIRELKQRINDLELQMTTVEQLMDAVAKAAFFAGAEYAGIAANERLNSASQKIRLNKQDLETLERELLTKEKDTIETTVTEDTAKY